MTLLFSTIRIQSKFRLRSLCRKVPTWLVRARVCVRVCACLCVCVPVCLSVVLICSFLRERERETSVVLSAAVLRCVALRCSKLLFIYRRTGTHTHTHTHIHLLVLMYTHMYTRAPQMLIGSAPPSLRKRFLKSRRAQQTRLDAPGGSPWVSVFRSDAHAFVFNSRTRRPAAAASTTGGHAGGGDADDGPNCIFDPPAAYAMITTDEQLLSALRIQGAYRIRLAGMRAGALGLQCVFRCHLARRTVGGLRRKFQHRLHQWRHARVRVARVREDLERGKAALVIQTFYRGCQVRALLKLNRAALILQTAYRGHQVSVVMQREDGCSG